MKLLHVLRAERDHRQLVFAAPLLNLQIAFGVSVLILFGNYQPVFIDPEKDRLVASFGIVDILLKCSPPSVNTLASFFLRARLGVFESLASFRAAIIESKVFTICIASSPPCRFEAATLTASVAGPASVFVAIVASFSSAFRF
jgi:hypothetical protein